MSKVRVYELSRELGLEHTHVEARCRELGIEVDNHLAQLDEADVERVKAALEANPGAEVQEKRVRKTVIRRRRRAEPRAAVQAEETTSAAAVPVTEAAVAAPATAASTAADAAAPSTPVEATSTAPADAPAAPPAAAKPAPRKEAAVKVRQDTKYGQGKAVNKQVQGVIEDRQSFVKVVGTIDPALAQNLARTGPTGPGRPSSPGGPRRRPDSAAPAGGVQAPMADRSDKLGNTSGRPDHGRKRRAGGRVAYDRTKDAGFDDLRRPRSRRGAKRRAVGQATEITIPKASKRVVKMDATITVGDLAQQLSIKAGVIIRYLMDMGEMVTVNNVLDLDTVTLIAQEHEFTVENVAFSIDNFVEEMTEDTREMKPRDPVITVMGHVDHGKTSLLDHIRKSRVAAGEAGGITQHIAAYKVPVQLAEKKRNLVFLDTPGHAAFTAMRARGAQVTDVVILVTAADDGVMPQTIEAINHSKAADVPIVVAINKCDKPDATPDKVRQQLIEHGLVPEAWGGDTQIIEVSAITGDGIDELLEAVALQAELLDLKAEFNGRAQGVVIEAELSRGRGPVATVLVQQGIIKRGDIVVAGAAMGRVRALVDDQGKQMKSAGPGTPLEILGLNSVPPPSERFIVVKDDRDARQIVSHLDDKDRDKRLATERKRVSLEDLALMAEAGEVKTLALIIKSDVQGSLEALRGSFEKLEHPELDVRIIHGGVGPISESDVALAAASQAIVIGFNVRPEKKAKAVAEQDRIEIKLYSVIYDAIDDVKAAMEGMLSPVIEERVLGKAEVRDTFKLKGSGAIAGCAVLQGKIRRNGLARLIRDGIVIYSGKIASLRRFKDTASEVERGKECGAQLHNYGDVKVGDEIECYEEIEVAQKLEL
jgi:translation initiation factor IF-2